MQTMQVLHDYNKLASQVFSEEGSAFNTFVKPRVHTQCGLVSNTERKQFVYMKTPQGTKL